MPEVEARPGQNQPAKAPNNVEPASTENGRISKPEISNEKIRSNRPYSY